MLQSDTTARVIFVCLCLTCPDWSSSSPSW